MKHQGKAVEDSVNSLQVLLRFAVRWIASPVILLELHDFDWDKCMEGLQNSGNRVMKSLLC